MKAFTLIELLVVIAVIAALSALLFAAFAMTKVNAHKVVDLSQLHEIGLASAMYANDNDSIEMGFANCLTPNECYYWKEMVIPYLRSSETLISTQSNDYYYDKWIDPTLNIVNRSPFSPYAFKNSFAYNGVGFNGRSEYYPVGSILNDYGLLGIGYKNNGELETRSVLDSSYDQSRLIRLASATAPDVTSPLHTDASNLDRSASIDFTVIGKATSSDHLLYSQGAKANGVYGTQIVELLADSHAKTRVWGNSKICDWYIQGCNP